MKPLRKARMFTPGPTPLLPEVMLEALIKPMNHRKDDFQALMKEIQKGLQLVFKTQNEVLLLSCSGSGAMEAAMVNLLAPGEKALIIVAGKFGERWQELAEKYGVQASVLKAPYGESVDPARVADTLRSEKDLSAVFMQATETSTGALMDIEQVGGILKDQGKTLLVVDAITGLGATPIAADEWGLDVVIGGSQKAFMLPPGLAMLSISRRAWQRIERCVRPRYYFDLLKEGKAQREGQTAFTPAISLIQGLKRSLDLILEVGIDNFVANAGLQAGSMRAAVNRLGMKIFPRCPSDAVTAFEPPAGVDPSKVIAALRDQFGVLISGGQGSMKGKILRIGHLGYFDYLETLGMIGCLEIALHQAGASIEIGSGARAAIEYFIEATKSK